ncbi:DUF1080 domain-containing protein [Fulvivirgaceae bacterium BMA12]|uniref:DUF1080 domain-containing protein n=1 Tax=Agaribacillus aureus TaxID=3051825 RepID=A0ABT8LFK6_9BACT|nr:DUF1080 domain-containing protein [Fulvivirgaceae bacterium BMA12]
MKQKECIRYWLFLLMTSILVTACTDKKEQASSKIPEKIPLKVLALNDMSAFDAPDNGWELVKDIYPNLLPVDIGNAEALTTVPGNGVLLKNNEEGQSPMISAGFEHEDLEVELSFLLPKNATATLLFQGKYGLELRDTWRNNSPGLNFCGTIPSSDNSNIIPSVNACKAPGLWQQLKVFFRCPRVDEQGNTIKEASFEYVYLNGHLIHKNVPLSAVSGTASAEDKKAGPLVFRTESPHFAIKDIKYQAYALAEISFEDITYRVYDSLFKSFPDFTTLQATDSGNTTAFEIPQLNLPYKHYGIVFKGTLNVPFTDTYLWQVDFGDGGEIVIDGKSIRRFIRNSGEFEERGALVDIEVGQHPFEIRLTKSSWRKNINIFYESASISKKDLVHDLTQKANRNPVSPILVKAFKQPEMVRGFVKHLGETKTHVISVGDPKGVHYTYNLKTGSLIKLWKGQFGDATAMWHSRGNTQLWHSGNFTLDIPDGAPVARLNAESDSWPKSSPESINFHGYHMDLEQRPVFDYSFDNLKVEEHIKPSADNLGLTKSIHINGDNISGSLWYRLASGEKIVQLSDLLYLVDGNYFLRMEPDNDPVPILRNDSELLVSIPKKLQSTIQYSLIW